MLYFPIWPCVVVIAAHHFQFASSCVCNISAYCVYAVAFIECALIPFFPPI